MNLNGKRILITRPRRQADEFARALREAGAQPLLFPVIEIGPPPWTPPCKSLPATIG